VIPESGYVSAVNILTTESNVADSFSDQSMPYFRAKGSDFVHHIDPAACRSAVVTDEGLVEVNTMDRGKFTAELPSGVIQKGSGADLVAIDWKSIKKVTFSATRSATSAKRSATPETGVTVTGIDGESIALPWNAESYRPIRWDGTYDQGINWVWFVPIVHDECCRGWIDICRVESITLVKADKSHANSTDESLSESEIAQYEFVLVGGKKLQAAIDAADVIPCRTPYGWVEVARGKIQQIVIHLDNIRPPATHLSTLPRSLGSRAGGAPFAKATLRNGRVFSLEGSRVATNVNNDSGTTIEETVKFQLEGEEASQAMALAEIVSIHWRGARGDEVQLKDGSQLKGRLDFSDGGALFGKVDDYVWVYFPQSELRKVEFSDTKPGEQAKAG